jgi:hypothetical protein
MTEYDSPTYEAAPIIPQCEKLHAGYREYHTPLAPTLPGTPEVITVIPAPDNQNEAARNPDSISVRAQINQQQSSGAPSVHRRLNAPQIVEVPSSSQAYEEPPKPEPHTTNPDLHAPETRSVALLDIPVPTARLNHEGTAGTTLAIATRDEAMPHPSISEYNTILTAEGTPSKNNAPRITDTGVSPADSNDQNMERTDAIGPPDKPPEGGRHNFSEDDDRRPIRVPGSYRETHPLATERLLDGDRVLAIGGVRKGQIDVSVYDITHRTTLPSAQEIAHTRAIGSIRTDLPRAQTNAATKQPNNSATPTTQTIEEEGAAPVENILVDWFAARGLTMTAATRTDHGGHGLIALVTEVRKEEINTESVRPRPEIRTAAEVNEAGWERLSEAERVEQFIERELTFRDANGTPLGKAELLDYFELPVDAKPPKETFGKVSIDNLAELSPQLRDILDSVKERFTWATDHVEHPDSARIYYAYSLFIHELIINWIQKTNDDRHIILFRWPNGKFCVTYFGWGNVTEEALADVEHFLSSSKRGLANALMYGGGKEGSIGERGRGFPYIQAATHHNEVEMGEDGHPTTIRGVVRDVIDYFDDIAAEDLGIDPEDIDRL